MKTDFLRPVRRCPRQKVVLAQSFRLTAAAGGNDAGRDDRSLAAANAAATRTEAAFSAWLDTATTRAAATGKASAAGKWTAAAATGHLAAGSTGSRRGVGIHEGPLVVMRPAFVDEDRRLFALTGHTKNAPSGSTDTRRLLRLLRLLSRGRHSCSTGRTGAARPASTRTGAARRRQVRADVQRLELAVLGHRVLVLLPEIFLLDEDVEVRRAGARPHLHLPEADRANVLFAAKNQLGFFLALSLVPPGGKQRSHEHGHHGEADQQRRHGVTPLAVLTL